MLSLSGNNQADAVEAFNSTSRYLLDDLLNIDNPYFFKMVSQIYPTEFQMNKANPSNTGAPLYPHAFLKKAKGILLSPPSFRPLCYLLLNHWTIFNQI